MRSELKTEHEWLGEVNSQALQSALSNLDTAYKNFFRDTHAVGFPKFKSRKEQAEFSVSAALQRGLREREQFPSPRQKIFLPYCTVGSKVP